MTRSQTLPPMPLYQVCWVVSDLQEGMQGWLAQGIGPFFRFEFRVRHAFYRSVPVQIHIEVALAQAGPMQIELIQQLNDAPSAYRDVVPLGESGLHHVCRAAGGYDEGVANIEAQGLQVAMSGTSGGTRFCYADTREKIGCMLEFVDDSPMALAIRERVSSAAIDWDGSDPVRPLDFASLLPRG